MSDDAKILDDGKTLDDRKSLLVLGGSSDIGLAVARAFAQRGWAIQLAGRDAELLQRNATDVAARSTCAATHHFFDALDAASFSGFVDGLPRLPDAVVSVVGILGEQARAESDLDHAAAIMRANYEGPSLILGLFGERFARRGAGTIIGVSSVAGDRGRASNYVYGSAKAGFTAFLSGLRNRLRKRGVRVMTVKPGFVRTRMTEGLKLPGPLTAEPIEVAEAIWRGVEKRRDIVYVRPIWALIMLIIRTMPEAIFKRLKL